MDKYEPPEAGTTEDGSQTVNGKISRRKLISALGLTGAAVVSGGLLHTVSGESAVTDAVYGKDGKDNKKLREDSIIEAESISYHYSNGLPERTLGNKLRERISVKDFGAKGDGITDDTSAIQNAINYAINEGRREIDFPHGTYMDTGTLMNTSSVAFIGENVAFTSGRYETASVSKAFDQIRILSNTAVNVESFPVQAPETDDTGRIQRAIDSIVATGKRGTLLFKAGKTYTISSKLSINMSYVSVIGYGAQINAMAITSGEAIHIFGSVFPPFYQSTNFIAGLRMYGAGKTSDTIGIKFQGTNAAPQGIASNASSHLAFYNLNIEKFGTGLYFGSHAYILSFSNCDIFSCGTCIHSPSEQTFGDTDYGENIAFNHCALYSSGCGFELHNGAGSFYFRDCSIDYNTKMGIVGGSAFVVIDGGHIEHRYKGLTGALFDIKEFGNLILSNLLFYIINDGYTGTDLPYLFDHSTAKPTSQLIIRDAWLRNIRTTTNRLCSGRIDISGTNLQFTGYIQSSDSMNMMPNSGDYESDLNMSSVHNVFIDDAGTVTNLTNTSNIDITVDGSTGSTGDLPAWSAFKAYIAGDRIHANNKNYKCTVSGTSGAAAPSHSSGTAIDGTTAWEFISTAAKSLKLNKKTALPAKVNLFVKPKKGSRVAFELFYKKPGTGQGTVTVRTRFANLKTKIVSDESGKYWIANTVSDQGFIEAFPLPFTAAEKGWTKITSTSSNLMSSIYDYFVIELDVSGFVGVMNVDKIVVTEM